MKHVLLAASGLAFLLFFAGCKQQAETPNAAGPSFEEVLTTRRSVRSYDPTKKISEAEVRTLLAAAQEAPSWANQEPTKYYVAIGDEKRLEVLNHREGPLWGETPAHRKMVL